MTSSKSPSRVVVFDTTLRDGEQAPGFHMNAGQKLAVARQLARMNVDVIEAGFPASSANDERAVAGIAASVGRAKDAPEICALARCVETDVDAAARAVAPAARPRIHVFIATSKVHIETKLRMAPDQVLERISAAVSRAKRKAPQVQFSAEDASRSDLAFLAAAVRRAVKAGARTVNIPDTVGYAVPHEFEARIRALRRRVPELSRVTLSAHCHDDLGMATANTLAAVRAGARQVEGAINGIGERAGNCATEEIVMAIRTRGDAFGVFTGVNARAITAASRLVAKITGSTVPSNKAVVGANAFAHGSGIHQDGMVKNPATYEIMRPEDVGADGTLIVLTARSGRRAVEHRLAALGASVSGAAFDRLFVRFKEAAERRRVVDDGALLRLARTT